MKILEEDEMDAVPRFFADTKGFEEIAGLQIGYPLIRSKENEEIKLYLHVLIEEDMAASDFLRSLNEAQINGQKVFSRFKDRQESDQIAVENSIMMLPVDLSFVHLFPNVELKNREAEVAFWKDIETYGNLVIEIDDVEIELELVTADMLAEGIYVQD